MLQAEKTWEYEGSPDSVQARKVQVAPARKSRSMLARHFNRNASLRSWRAAPLLMCITPGRTKAEQRTLSVHSQYTAVDKENPFTD